MAFESDRRVFAGTAQQAAYDEGLRAYMLRVYNYMTIGLVVTGFVALLTASSPTAMNAIYGTPLRWLVMLAPLGFIIFLSMGLHKMSFATAQAVFWAFAAAMGVSLSYIFMVYTGGSIARVFFITAGAFAGLSLYGYTTKKDLSGMRTFLMMGLIGIIIASVVNIFMASSALHFAISVIGVLVFSGLTAYDTQNIKNEYAGHHNSETAGKLAISGALRLYLDFINLFVMLLSLFGNRN